MIIRLQVAETLQEMAAAAPQQRRAHEIRTAAQRIAFAFGNLFLQTETLSDLPQDPGKEPT